MTVKRLSIVLAVLSAVALTAAIAAGSASATVLCKSAPATHVCPESDRYAGSTDVYLNLSSTATIKTKGGTTVQSCTEGAILTNAWAADGGSTAYDGFDKCTRSHSNLGTGWAEITWIEGTHNGLVTLENQVEVNTIFGKCTFMIEGPGELQAGLTSARVVFINAKTTTESGACPKEMHFNAEYLVETPTPLYVEKE